METNKITAKRFLNPIKKRLTLSSYSKCFRKMRKTKKIEKKLMKNMKKRFQTG
jgi:hypothetical protein